MRSSCPTASGSRPGTTPRDWTEETLAKIRGVLSRVHRPSRRRRAGQPPGDRLRHQPGRTPARRTLPRRDDRRAPGADLGSEERRGRGERARAECRSTSGRSGRASTTPSRRSSSAASRLAGESPKPEDVPALVAEVAAWQKGLWKFSSVGHIGKVGGPKAWMEPVSPLVAESGGPVQGPALARRQGRDPLARRDRRGGRQRPRLRRLAEPEARRAGPPGPAPAGRPPGRPRPGRDAASGSSRTPRSTSTPRPRPRPAQGRVDVADLARQRGLDPDALRAWLDYLGIVPAGAVEPDRPLHRASSTRGGGYDFINGWGLDETPATPDELVRSARPHPRQHEAARRGGPPLAHPPRGRRLAAAR